MKRYHTEHQAKHARASKASVRSGRLVLDLVDGRQVSAPVAWFPRLQNATFEQWANYRLVGDGAFIHWPDVDEDIEVAHVLAFYDGGAIAWRK